MYSEVQTITSRSEEREEYLDIFSTCETCLREETALTNQLFDDLGRYCPSDLDTCEPLAMNATREEIANARFRALLNALGIETPADLSEAANATVEDCIEVFSNPLQCEGKRRAAILNALGESARLDVWQTHDPLTGLSVGECLAEWTRANFKTPWQYRRQALECELKCYLLGVVDCLEDSEIENLINAPSLHSTMKEAAAQARIAALRNRAAAYAFNAALGGLCRKYGNESE